MDLNIHTERKNPFNFKNFKEDINLFLLSNQIKSSTTSPEIIKALSTLRSIVESEILNKEETGLELNIENAFISLEKLGKSEIFENLIPNEKSVFICLIEFTKQYINALKTNKVYYTDLSIRYEKVLIKSDIQELFNFSKKCFALSLKNKKISFDDNITKEISLLQKEYGFTNIFFRKPINLRDKIVLLKNIETLKKTIKEISEDLNIEKKALSLHGLISISFEPTLLGYSAATAYMRKENNSYVISLGLYKDLNSLKESYIHEMAHCFDYSNIIDNKKLSYSEEALIGLKDLKECEDKTPIQEIMLKEIMVENYSKHYNIEYQNMKEDMIKVMKKEFNVTEETLIKSDLFNKGFELIINNFFNINTYSLAKVKISVLLLDNFYHEKSTKLIQTEYSKEEIEFKHSKLEKKLSEIRSKYKYITSKNVSFFIHMNKSFLLEKDLKENKQYYTKPVEIFARAFELIYQKKSTPFNEILTEEQKVDFKVLLKKSIEYMLHNNLNNKLNNKRKI